MVPIEELLKNKIIKTSLAEVAEYLEQVLVEKWAQEHTTSPATFQDATPPSENAEEVQVVKEKAIVSIF